MASDKESLCLSGGPHLSSADITTGVFGFNPDMKSFNWEAEPVTSHRQSSHRVNPVCGTIVTKEGFSRQRFLRI
jgi:hypothetical protein